MRPLRPLILVAGLSASPAALAGVEIGLGGAAGGAFSHGDSDTEGIGFFTAAGSPLLSVQVDPTDGLVRPVLGVSSAPTFLYSVGYDAYTLPLLVAELGVAVGSDTTRGTLGVHGGLLSVGAGARFTHVPWELGKAHTGLEVRATWLLRYGGYLGAMWVVRFG